MLQYVTILAFLIGQLLAEVIDELHFLKSIRHAISGIQILNSCIYDPHGVGKQWIGANAAQPVCRRVTAGHRRGRAVFAQHGQPDCAK